MKKFGLHFSMILLVALPSLAQRRGGPTLKSPEIHPDRTVTFRLSAPKASQVTVTGDLLKQAQALEKDDKGVWTVTIGPLRPDLYSYRFSVDGSTVTDPSNQFRPATMFIVPGDGAAIYDLRAVPHGEVHERWYTSKSLDSVRRIFVYTPPNYEKSSAKYPVLYLIHGAGGDESNWTESGKANLILDNLMVDGKLKPLVVVMPYGNA